MSAALAATKILKKMAEEGSDADEAEAMRRLATHYEKHAIGMASPLRVAVLGLKFLGVKQGQWLT